MDANTPFTCGRQPAGFVLVDFWKWAFSDLRSNALRGVLAEFIVAKALGEECNDNRLEWDACDLLHNGINIEVKSAAYIQSWNQKKESKIVFGIQKTKAWHAADNTYSDELKRQADIYVFCHLKDRNRETLDPLNLDQWDFYVLRTETLNERCVDQKTISLSSLRQLEPEKADLAGLRAAIEGVSSRETVT